MQEKVLAFSAIVIFLNSNDVINAESFTELLMLMTSVVDNGLPFFCHVTSIPDCPVRVQFKLKVVPLFTTIFSIPFLIIGTEPLEKKKMLNHLRKHSRIVAYSIGKGNLIAGVPEAFRVGHN